MSDSKTRTIKINEADFSFKGKSRTRKNRKERADKPAPKIKVRGTDNTRPRNKNTSSLKRNMLRMFRNHYDEKRKQKQAQTGTSPDSTAPNPLIQPRKPKINDPPFPSSQKGDFESSLDYFNELSSTMPSSSTPSTHKPSYPTASSNSSSNSSSTSAFSITDMPPSTSQPYNKTLKHHHPLIQPAAAPAAAMPIIAPHLPPPTAFNMNTMFTPSQDTPMKLTPPPMIPKYGCLKNGTLPTYRTWRHNTQRQYPSQNTSTHHTTTSIPSQQIPVQRNIPKPDKDSFLNMSNIPSQRYEQTMQQRLKQMSLRDQWKDLSQPQRTQHLKPPNPKKQKRIHRRTFHVGKSKQYPQVSVLVSNRTIRNRTNLRASELKQTPLPEVKKYLLKQGFIKKGTTTPIDVLRQMYENACMICGEVKNFNPENILYNYFNPENDEEL